MTLMLGINARSNLRVTRRSAWLRLPIIASACVAALGAALSAQAQQASGTAPSAEASGGALEEVVVTAERREENIQNVPITVSAFSAETMQSRNLTDIKSLGNLTPGVNLDAGAPFSGDRSVLSASIRGIGQDDFAFNLNPGVGVYVDGVYLARTIGANQNLLDVDRVEILKGPQGTLFGANTIGGAISITTHTPGDEERFIAQATGGSYDRRDFGFTADIPIIKGVLLSQYQRVLAGADRLDEGRPLSDQLTLFAGRCDGHSDDRLRAVGLRHQRHLRRPGRAGHARQAAVERH